MSTPRSADRVVALLADAQHGVVARRQLLALGVGRGELDGRIARGVLVPLHRGVYAVGHRRLRREGFWLAAVLATGPRAALSHRDAAALHGLRPPSDAARVDVTSPVRPRATAAIRVRARRVLDPADVTTVAAIPVTTVARTLVDLAEVSTPARLAAVLGEAERRGVLDVAALDGAIDRTRGRSGPGLAVLRAALAEHARHGARISRSPLEDRFAELVDRAGLPQPELNARVAGFEVDALWRARRLVVELDGWAFHGGRAAFARDRAKGNRLKLAGFDVLRYTHDDLLRDAARVAAELRAALSAPGSRRAAGRSSGRRSARG